SQAHMCSREAPEHPVTGPKPPAPRTPGALLPNCNYRRDLAVSLDAVGRRTTGDRPLTCALTRHPGVRPRCTSWLNETRQRTANPKAQIPNPNDIPGRTTEARRTRSFNKIFSVRSVSPCPVPRIGFLILDLGFGI